MKKAVSLILLAVLTLGATSACTPYQWQQKKPNSGSY